MILTHLGYGVAERKAVVAAVGASYMGRVRVNLLNLEGDHLHDLTDYLTDGQVDGDWTQPVGRTCSVTFTDPGRALPFDADDPQAASVDLRRMLRIIWELWIPAWEDFAEIPVFTGPVNGMQRDGDQAIISCEGKAAFGMGDCWDVLHLQKGMKKTDAIRRILTERMGAPAHELDIPDLAGRLPKPISLHRQAKPWHYARKIAKSMDRDLFYDGAGVCRLRHHPQQPRFSFTGAGHVTTPIQVGYDKEQLKNAVFVTGAQPKGPKTQVTGEAVAPANHKFSPAKLGRNDVPRYLAEYINDDALKTRAEAKARADRELNDGLTQSVEVSFSCMPVPFLDLGDMCHVHTDDGDVTFRLRQFSLPLRVGDDGAEGTAMTVGLKKRLTRSHPKHQGHHRHRRRAA